MKKKFDAKDRSVAADFGCKDDLMIRASGGNDDADLVHGDEALASEEDKYCSWKNFPANALKANGFGKSSNLERKEISTMVVWLSDESDWMKPVAMTGSFAACFARKF